ncbi:protease PrsW [Bacteroidota bacterium]|nr:protease PrsW [Bacteroidota bacterium]
MILIALALAPGLAIMIFIYWKDKFDREPKRLLALSFLLGAISIIPAIVLEEFFSGYSKSIPIYLLSNAVNAVLVVGLAEEGSKYFMTRYFLYPHKSFNEPFDGITYSVMVSMGFATVENLIYVLNNGGMETALLRMVTAVPAHATFGVVMGYYLGLKKFDTLNRNFGLKAIAYAALLHGAYDFFLFINYYPGMAIGALLSLRYGIVFSQKAIRLHQQSSPFRKTE